MADKIVALCMYLIKENFFKKSFFALHGTLGAYSCLDVMIAENPIPLLLQRPLDEMVVSRTFKSFCDQILLFLCVD